MDGVMQKVWDATVLSLTEIVLSNGKRYKSTCIGFLVQPNFYVTVHHRVSALASKIPELDPRKSGGKDPVMKVQSISPVASAKFIDFGELKLVKDSQEEDFTVYRASLRLADKYRGKFLSAKPATLKLGDKLYWFRYVDGKPVKLAGSKLPVYDETTIVSAATEDDTGVSGGFLVDKLLLEGESGAPFVDTAGNLVGFAVAQVSWFGHSSARRGPGANSVRGGAGIVGDIREVYRNLR